MQQMWGIVVIHTAFGSDRLQERDLSEDIGINGRELK
jgi:hypothetical protein